MKHPGRNNTNKALISMGRHLVYSEGTKTEPQYVDNIAEHIKYDSTHRNILVAKKYNKAAHTLDLIRRAEDDLKKERKAGKTVDGLWILFDKDSFPDFDEACKIIEEKNIKKNADGILADEQGTVWYCCYSNESFEIWPYLHYEDLKTSLSRDLYIAKINNFIKSKGFSKKYKKTEKKLYDFLIDNGGDVRKAILYAKRKDPGKKHNKPNPSTALYQFVEFFMAYFG